MITLHFWKAVFSCHLEDQFQNSDKEFVNAVFSAMQRAEYILVSSAKIIFAILLLINRDNVP